MRLRCNTLHPSTVRCSDQAERIVRGAGAGLANVSCCLRVCHAATAMAYALGPTVWPEDIIVDDITAGSIVVSFHLNAPLGSTVAAYTMIDELTSSGQEIEIRTNRQVFTANAAELVQSGLSCEVATQSTNCTVGYFLDGDTGCVACPSGKHDHDWDFHSECVDCAAGYTSQAASTSCTAQQCTSGTIVSGASTMCSGSTGDICDYQCNQGYVAVGLHFCGRDGSFAGGSCEPADCTAGLTIANSQSTCSGSTYAQCQYTCHCGYFPRGTHVCQPDGNFTGGSCIACPEGQTSIGNGPCSQCTDGTAPSPSKCDCAACAGSAGKWPKFR